MARRALTSRKKIRTGRTNRQSDDNDDINRRQEKGSHQIRVDSGREADI